MKHSKHIVEQSQQKNLKPASNRQSAADLTSIYDNVGKPNNIGYELRHDTFKDEIMISPTGRTEWRSLKDEDYARIRLKLEGLGLTGVSKELIKDAVKLKAQDYSFDSAIEWLTNEIPSWDGINRIETFTSQYFGTEDTPYTRALGLYMWTAMAGRVLEPGIKADMVPILVGEQGACKSTGIQAISPAAEFFTEISLTDRDSDQSRKMRGHLIGEIAELRGINTREVEAIKAFITRTHEEWIPKYREFSISYPRRIFLIGTTNESNFLSDDTGNRRWLPIKVREINVAEIKRDRIQLWAEARDKFLSSGILYKEVEKLSKSIYEEFMIIDPWAKIIQEWLSSNKTSEITTHSVLIDCLDFHPKNIDRRSEIRVGKALRYLGFEKKQMRLKGQTKNVYLLKALMNTVNIVDTLNHENDGDTEEVPF
jgi:predicted P-loop ATPase